MNIDINHVTEQEAFIVGHLLLLQLEREPGDTEQSRQNIENINSFLAKMKAGADEKSKGTVSIRGNVTGTTIITGNNSRVYRDRQ
jgi:hypothetical protein